MILEARRTSTERSGGRSGDQPAHPAMVIVTSGSGDLSERLARVSRSSGEGVDVGFEIDPADGPPAALVAVAMVAGASALVLPDDAEGSGLAREVRRAADLADALLVERARS